MFSEISSPPLFPRSLNSPLHTTVEDVDDSSGPSVNKDADTQLNRTYILRLEQQMKEKQRQRKLDKRKNTGVLYTSKKDVTKA